MKFLSGIRRWGSERRLNKNQTEQRRPQVYNFHGAQEVGILFNSLNEHYFLLVKKYVKFLKEAHGMRHVLAMGYVDSKEEPIYHKHQLNFDFFTQKDLNWWGVPNSDICTNFCSNDFDILLDFTSGDCLQLRHMAQRSKSKFKVGRVDDLSIAYDLIIQIDQDAAFDKYVEQINSVLTNINHHDEKKRV